MLQKCLRYRLLGEKLAFAIELVENPGLMPAAARPPNPGAPSSFPPELVNKHYWEVGDWYTHDQIKTIKANKTICFSFQMMRKGQNLLIEVICQVIISILPPS